LHDLKRLVESAEELYKWWSISPKDLYHLAKTNFIYSLKVSPQDASFWEISLTGAVDMGVILRLNWVRLADPFRATPLGPGRAPPRPPLLESQKWASAIW